MLGVVMTGAQCPRIRCTRAGDIRESTMALCARVQILQTREYSDPERKITRSLRRAEEPVEGTGGLVLVVDLKLGAPVAGVAEHWR